MFHYQPNQKPVNFPWTNIPCARSKVLCLCIFLILGVLCSGCKKSSEPGSTNDDEWEAAKLKEPVVIYGRLINDSIDEIGRFTNQEKIYDVLEVKENVVHISDGTFSGWAYKNELISAKAPVAPARNDVGDVDHQMINEKVTVISWNTKIRVGKKTIGYKQVGQNLTVSKVSGDWLFVDSDGGGWIDQSAVVKYEDAVEYFSTKIENRTNADSYNCRASVYAHRDELEKAIADYSKAIEISPDNYHLYYNRAIRLAYMRQPEKAIEDYNKAIDLNPRLVVGYDGRASAKFELHQYEGAIKDYDEALRLKPRYADALGGRARCFKELGNFESAIVDYKYALRISPGAAWIRNSFAWLLATCADEIVRDGPNAIEHAMRACELTKWKEDSYVGTLAAAYAADGQFEKAIKYLDQAIELDPDSHMDIRETMYAAFKANKPYTESSDIEQQE